MLILVVPTLIILLIQDSMKCNYLLKTWFPTDKIQMPKVNWTFKVLIFIFVKLSFFIACFFYRSVKQIHQKVYLYRIGLNCVMKSRLPWLLDRGLSDLKPPQLILITVYLNIWYSSCINEVSIMFESK